MNIGEEDLAELRAFCPEARYLEEGGTGFIDLPGLTFRAGKGEVTRDALLSLQTHSGYTSRLYLSEPVAGFGQNWTIHSVLGRAWHTPSWNGVAPDKPIVMLRNHLRVYSP